MQESEKLIQIPWECIPHFSGRSQVQLPAWQSATLVEQGPQPLLKLTTIISSPASRLAGCCSLYLLDDLKKRRNHAVVINRDDRQRRQTIVLNAEGDNGELTNDISRLNTHIALAPLFSRHRNV